MQAMIRSGFAGAVFQVCCILLEASQQKYAFEDYLQDFGKAYPSETEYTLRKSLFEQRATEVTEHNARTDALWVAGFNDLTDATPEEMQRLFGYNKAMKGHVPGIASGMIDAASFDVQVSLEGRNGQDLPESVDWRRQSPSVVTPVKYQGGCGSCWAFAASQVMESHLAISTGVLMSLSPQQINSCTPNPRQCGGTGGCDGATSQLAFAYAAAAGGLADVWHYPYLSGTQYQTLDCQNDTNGTVVWPQAASNTGFVSLPENDPEALMEAVATKGPIAVSVASSGWWRYQGGIFDDCNKTAPNINHAVVLEGYGIENATKYWLIRNSWGTSFGEAGYIRLRRYDNEPCGEDPEPFDGFACKAGGPKKVWACGECGVLSDSSYPTGMQVGARQTSRHLSQAVGTDGSSPTLAKADMEPAAEVAASVHV